MFDFLKPRWKKEAKLLHKGAKKFIHYKRDLLPEDRIAEIESRRSDLLAAMKAGDRPAVEEAGKQLRATCEQALPSQVHQTWWEENVEVIWVALVVALGIRAYLLQPFRIPTGSMQPTLNGIIIQDENEDFKPPWFGQRVFDLVWSGTSYKNIVAERPKRVVATADRSWFLLTRTEVRFDDNSKIKLPVAKGEVDRLVWDYEYDASGEPVARMGKTYEAGQPILRGRIVTGDLVLVDKVSYHFRKPKRGEVFVFDTRAIPTSGTIESARLAGQEGGTHYIKRLCGVPGDDLSIQQPDLLNHGKILNEPGIQRVARREDIYGGPGRPGYHYADERQARKNGFPRAPLDRPGEVLHLKAEAPPGLREYAALGDNTGNSLDSRYWGAVHEFNLVGPGWFSLWPFGSGHWGFIH